VATFTLECVQTARILEADAFATAGRTALFHVNTIRVVGATRRQEHVRGISAGASNVGIPLDPVSDAASGSVLWVEFDQPIDTRLGASNATMISGARFLLVAATVSSIFVMNPSSTTSAIMYALTVGGASAATSIPLA